MNKKISSLENSGEKQEAKYINSIVSSVNRRYFLGFIIIVCFYYFSFDSVSRIIKQENKSVVLINMLSQQRFNIGEVLNGANRLLREGDNFNIYKIRGYIKDKSQEINVLQQQIKTYISKNGVGDYLEDDVYHLYFSGDLSLDKDIQQYIYQGVKVSQISSDNFSYENHDFFELNKKYNSLSIKLTDFINLLDNNNILVRLDDLEGILILCLILIFLIKFFIIVYPVNRQLSKGYKDVYRANRAKNEFLSSMSHEIRTPMNGIIGNAENLMAMDINDKQKKYTSTILDSAENLLKLINDVLDYSKMKSGSLSLDCRSFNMEVLAKEVIQLSTTRAQDKKIELILRYVPGTPQFMVGDPTRIRQVLINVIENAIKFTSQGYVSLTIDIEKEKKFTIEDDKSEKTYINITVKDTGIGIPKEKIHVIFEKFSQVDSSSTRYYEGIGIGLSICKVAIEMMGGSIEVDSIEGKGSTFLLSIPLGIDDNAHESISTPDILEGLKVIVVDDLEINRDLLKEQLDLAGINCVAFSSGPEALKELKLAAKQEEPYDLAILDYMMPEMDGGALTAAIKSTESVSDIPIVILSSMGEQEYINQLTDAGVSAILSKPVRNEKLLQILVTVWESKKDGNSSKLVALDNAIISNNSGQGLDFDDIDKKLNHSHVLLVEDNRINCALAEEMLLEKGITVTCAENGQAAVEAIRDDHSIDLILMDCMMPVMDGFSAAENIRKLPHLIGRQLPIIALTANVMKGDKEKCLKAGMDDYLSKPVRRQELYPMLSKWLDEKTGEDILVNSDIVDVSVKKENVTSDVPKKHGHGENNTNLFESTLLPDDFDMEAFMAARKTMKKKFPLMIQFFMEDTEKYITQIELGIDEVDPGQIITPAHTIKSSSKQIGATTLSEYAKKIEFLAKGMDGDTIDKEKIDDISPILNNIKSEFVKVNIFLADILNNELSHEN